MIRQESLIPALFPEMSPEEQRVWNYLKFRQGRERAITGRELEMYTGIDWRTCRDIIKTLVEAYGKRIGSVPGSPPGYFVIATAGELEDVCSRYRGQALSLLRREAILRRMSVRELLGQMELQAMERADGHREPT